MGTNFLKLNKVPLLDKNWILMFRGLLPQNLLLCQYTIITAILNSQMLMSVPYLYGLKEVEIGGQ